MSTTRLLPGEFSSRVQIKLKTLIPRLGTDIKVQIVPEGEYHTAKLMGIDLASGLIKVNSGWLTPLYLDGSERIIL